MFWRGKSKRPALTSAARESSGLKTQATKAPDDFVFGIPERSEMPLSQHPRLRRDFFVFFCRVALDYDLVAGDTILITILPQAM